MNELTRKKVYKILFVCLGNVCRSPLAESALAALLERRGLEREFKVDSAGTHAQRHAGRRPDPRAIEVASRRRYSTITKQRSRAITEKDFQSFDRIVAMDASNLSHLQKICPPDFQHKLHLLLEFAAGMDALDIPDPYYGSVEGFENVLSMCEAGVAGLLDVCLRDSRSPAHQTR